MARSQIQNRRRSYFIKREYQTKFMLKFCILVILTALISAFVLYHFSNQSVTTVFENSRLTIKPSTEFILPGLILSSLISVVIVGVATVIVALFVSHQIIGPIHRLESLLERLGSGDLGFDIHFRKKDEVKTLAKALNEASQNLSNLIGSAKTESAQLNSAINELKLSIGNLSEEQKGALKEAIEKIETVKKRLDERLDKFRLR